MSHSQLSVLFLLTVQSFSIFGCKEYNQSDFVVDHLVMSMCRVFSCVVGKGFCYDQCVLLAKLYQPCSALFCTPRPNLPVTPGVSSLPTFAFQSPIRKKTSFWVLVLKGLVGLHRAIHFSFFSITGLGVDLNYRGIEWFAQKRTEIILSFLRFRPSTTFWTPLLTMMATPFLLRDSCPQQQI